MYDINTKIGEKGLMNLKNRCISPDNFNNDIFYNEIEIYLSSYTFTCGNHEIKLEVFSNLNTVNKRLQQILKIYKIIKKNNEYFSLELNIYSSIEKAIITITLI